MLKRILCTLLVLSFLSACVPAAPAVSPVQTTVPTPKVESTPEQTASTNWWRDAVFYEIFVRSFYDTDNNGIGDFNGITQKLDYIQSLGVNAIWLMPIHPSPSYHGYDVTNYYDVNPQYGTLDDFKNLLAEAHKRDIHIIIDFVVNHTSNQHPWFKEAEQDPNSLHRDWYIWSETDPGYKGPWGERVWHSSTGGFYYGIFVANMPDLNYTNPEVTKEMNKVAAFWLTDIGVDGFRVDAAQHLIEENTVQKNTLATHKWYRNFYTEYKTQKPQAYSVGEVIGAGSSIIKSYTGDQLDHIFNFEMSSGFVNSAKGNSNSGINSAYKFALMDMPDFNFATFLTNHDQTRVMSVLNGDVDKAKMAAFLMLTTPGTPFIYYGEEIGMTGQKPDEDLRLPMQWSADPFAGFSDAEPWRAPAKGFEETNISSQTGDTNSLLEHYRALIALRRSNSALRSGEAKLLEIKNTGVFSAVLTNNSETLLVLANLTDAEVTDYKLNLSEAGLAESSYSVETLFGVEQAKEVAGSTDYKPFENLQPYAMVVIKLNPK